MSSGKESALSFGAAADLYDTVRPSYPQPAVAWALAPLGAGRFRVADIGAGTGIMTRLLIEAGAGRAEPWAGRALEVVAVEPDPGMRRRLLETTPSATAVAGSAESIPLPDGSLDGAIAAQAYHWFDHARAHAELARVIRLGGVFAAVWNDRDEATAWVAEYTRLIGSDGAENGSSPGERRPTSFGGGFGDVQVARFHHSSTQTPEGLVRLLQSRSYYLTAPAARQQELVEGMIALARRHPDLAGRASFELPYVTSVYRAVRR